MIAMMTQEGAQRDMKFTACDVSKALASVSQMCVRPEIVKHIIHHGAQRVVLFNIFARENDCGYMGGMDFTCQTPE